MTSRPPAPVSGSPPAAERSRRLRRSAASRSRKLVQRSSRPAITSTGTPRRLAASTSSCWSTKSIRRDAATAHPISRAPLAIVPDMVTTGMSPPLPPQPATPSPCAHRGATSIRPAGGLSIRFPAHPELDDNAVAVLGDVVAPVVQSLPVHEHMEHAIAAFGAPVAVAVYLVHGRARHLHLRLGQLATAVLEPLRQAGAHSFFVGKKWMDVDDTVGVGVHAGLPGREVRLAPAADEYCVERVPVVAVHERPPARRRGALPDGAGPAEVRELPAHDGDGKGDKQRDQQPSEQPARASQKVS